MSATLIVIKPHAVQRGLAGTFLARFERMGLRVAAIRVVEEPPEFWDRFYPSDESWFENVGEKTLEDCLKSGIDVQDRLGTREAAAIGRIVKRWLVEHMSSGESIAAVLEGNEAAEKVRKACGATLPNMAAPGTIRFDFSTDSATLANEERRPVYNLIHASDPTEIRDGEPAAAYEIGMLFPGLKVSNEGEPLLRRIRR